MNVRHMAGTLLGGLPVLLTGLAVPARAQVARDSKHAWDRMAFISERLLPVPVVDPLKEVSGKLDPAVRSAFQGFLKSEGGTWTAVVDRRNGRIQFASGSGLPWIPGGGNNLKDRDIASLLAGKGKVDSTVLEPIARAFLARHGVMLGVDGRFDLVLEPGRSSQPADYLWFLDFGLTHDGVPIEGARIFFRLNHGNVVQFGSENLPVPGTTIPRFSISREQALASVDSGVGGLSATTDTFLDPGSRHLLTAAPASARTSEDFPFGNGAEIAAIWEFVFRREGVAGTWRARVDASNGALLAFEDVNQYSTAQVTGGVYPVSYVYTPESVLPMPFADLSTGGYSNSAGLFNYTSGTVTTTLNGQYVRIVDNCGAISESGTGSIALGTSTGTDCTVPTGHSAGDTHSTRSQFYLVNRAKEKGRSWLPTNTWLQAKLTVNVNINATCNAFWSNTNGTLNFYRSGGGCGNTGEIAGVSLHEYGHGLDRNDGNSSSPDGGTGETYGDWTATLQTHDSCMGSGFDSAGLNCGGYGNACTSCSGVRDIDYAKHATATPATPANFNVVNCPTATCVGPCNRECHCESAPSSQANWDMVNRDLVDPLLTNLPLSQAWTLADRLWYLSRSTATGAFTCARTGQDGCAGGTLYKVYLVADDDDGNLANGTPHACAIFAAFDRHGIACGTAGSAENACNATCTPPAAPTGLTLSTSIAAPNQIDVSWNTVGSGYVYDLYRNEMGCSQGFTRIANDLATTSYTDTAVAGCYTYYYQVVAHPTGKESCAGAPSTCSSVVSGLPTPAGVAAVANGNNRIDISWSAVTGATSCTVYRSTTSGGPYTTNVGSTASTSLSDLLVAGDITYYYVVQAAASCQSATSAQASATAVGTCPLPPKFGGLVSVSPAYTSSCAIALDWTSAPATSQCAGSGTMTYSVYRSISSSFTPDASNRIATGLTTTTYADSAALSPGTTYYYVVRATDSRNGVEDSNSVTKSGIPYGTTTSTVLYSQNFDALAEGNAAGYTYTAIAGATTDWRGVMICNASSGTKILRCGGNGCTNDYGDGNHAYARSPVINVPAGARNLRLTFAHRLYFESGYDGAYLRISLNGTSFTYVAGSAILAGGYNDASGPWWSGNNSAAFSNVTVDLDAACNMVPSNTGGCGGKTVYIGFTEFSDSTVNYDGWFIDDVVVRADVPTACSATPDGVQAITQTSYASKNTVEWWNPSGVYGGTRINYSNGTTVPAAPASATVGSVLVNGRGTANAHDVQDHVSLSAGNFYNYGAWVNSLATMNGQWAGPGDFTLSAPAGSISAPIVWTYSTGAAALASPRKAYNFSGLFAASNDRFLHSMAPGTTGGLWPTGWRPTAMNASATQPPFLLQLNAGDIPAYPTVTRVAFAGGLDGRVYAFDATNGTELWRSAQLGGMITANPQLMHTSYGGTWNLVFVGTRDAMAGNKFCALNMSNGSTAWCFDNGGGAGSIGIISGPALIDAAWNNSTYPGQKRAFFASRARGGGSNQTMWEVSFTNTTVTLLASSAAAGNIDGAPTTGKGGQIVVGNNNGEIWAFTPTFSPNTLAEAWHRTGFSGAVKEFVSYDSTRDRLVFSTTNTTWAIPATGAPGSDWSVALNSPSRPLPVYGSPYVLVGACNTASCSDGSGKLVQLDSSQAWSSGQQAWTIPASGALGGVTVDRGASPKTAHVGSASGRIYTVQLGF